MIEKDSELRISFKSSITKNSLFTYTHPFRFECLFVILKNVMQPTKTFLDTAHQICLEGEHRFFSFLFSSKKSFLKSRKIKKESMILRYISQKDMIVFFNLKIFFKISLMKHFSSRFNHPLRLKSIYNL